MKVFVTGGSGYLGPAVVSALVAGGAETLALARRPSSSARLEKLGARVHRGDLAEPSSFVAAAAACDATIHLAQSTGSGRSLVDRGAVEALLEALRAAGQPRSFSYTSVLFVLGAVEGEPATEATVASPPAYMKTRAEIEAQVLAGGSDQVATSVVRPGMIYGGGLGGMVSEMFQSAIEEGSAAFIGDGVNRWSLVHRDDVASLFRVVCEQRARGVFHAVDGAPLPVRAVAEAASAAAGKGGVVRRLDLDAAVTELGDFARALCLDQPVLAPASLALGWSPAWPSFIDGAARAFAELQQA